jgi:hypothetical protein
MAKVMKINLETTYAAFFDISGHVDAIGVKVVLSKEKYNSPIYERSLVRYSPYTDDAGEDFEYVVMVLQDVDARLNAILKQKVDFARIVPRDAHKDMVLYTLIDGDMTEILPVAFGEDMVVGSDGRWYRDDLYTRIEEKE